MSLGTLRGKSRVSVGLEWTNSIVSFSTSNLWNTIVYDSIENVQLSQSQFQTSRYQVASSPRTPQAYQLYVVDAFLGKLLQGSFGRLLQRESETLKCLVLTLNADLCLHLQGAASKHTNLVELPRLMWFLYCFSVVRVIVMLSTSAESNWISFWMLRTLHLICLNSSKRLIGSLRHLTSFVFGTLRAVTWSQASCSLT